MFTGLPLPEAARESIGRWLGPWRGRFADLKWVDDDLLHVSLHFFGELERDQVAVLADDLRAVAAAPIPATLGAAGWLGRPPRVIVMHLTRGVDMVTALQGIYARRIRRLGHRTESRPYVPHVTLARVRRGVAQLAWLQQCPEVSFAFGRLVLFESVPGKRGPQYVPVRSVTLEAAEEHP